MSTDNETRAVEFLKQIVDQADEDSFETVIAEARLWLDQVLGAPPAPLEPERRVEQPPLRKNRYGFYCVPVPTPSGRAKLVSTGEKVRGAASKLVRECGIDRLVLLAKSGAVTADAVVIATTGRRLTCQHLFQTWKEEIGASAATSTVEKYTEMVAAFFQNIGAWARPVAWITRVQLSAFINAPGIKHATRELRKAALSSFYKYAQAHGAILGNLLSTVAVQHHDLSWEEQEPKQIFPITEAEYRRIVEAKLPRFYHCATIISYWTGLRFVDICRMEPAAIQDDSLIVWTRKRRWRLVLPFSNPLIGAPELVECLREMRAHPFTPELCFSEGLDYDEREPIMSAAYKRLLQKIGIEDRTFNSLRHAAISRFRAAGVSLQEIGGLVGHGSTHTTWRYVHPPTKESL